MRPICPICGKVSIQHARILGLNGKNTLDLKCGHTIQEDVLPEYRDWQDLRSLKGKRLYPFQTRSCEIARDMRLRFICTHRMRLGKTVICCSLLKKYKQQMGRTLIVCKANLTVQWLMEVFEWSTIMSQRIETSKDPLYPNFEVFIISMDLLKAVPWAKTEVFKTVILDEVQNFKNLAAQRTKAAKDIALRAEYVIGLSGTPIKNHMAEYYPILHMVRPDRFPTEAGFVSTYVDYYNSGYGFRYGGAKNYKTFQEKTKEFIFGYTREEVMPDLPQISRSFRFLDLDKQVDQSYRKVLGRWREAYINAGDDAQQRFAQKGKQRQELMNMYSIIGLAKVKPTMDFVEEFLEDNGHKIVIYVEHIAVGDMLESGLNNILKAKGLSSCYRIRGGIDAEDSEDITRRMRADDKGRILIASTRACQEGKDFSFCHEGIMVERQWNASNEEQAECRLIHPTRASDPIDITYMVARKTIDEAHAQLVEKKREISHKALGEDVAKWADSDFMAELSQYLLREA